MSAARVRADRKRPGVPASATGEDSTGGEPGLVQWRGEGLGLGRWRPRGLGDGLGEGDGVGVGVGAAGALMLIGAVSLIVVTVPLASVIWTLTV